MGISGPRAVSSRPMPAVSASAPEKKEHGRVSRMLEATRLAGRLSALAASLKRGTLPDEDALANSDRFSAGETASWAAGLEHSLMSGSKVARISQATFGTLASMASGVEQYVQTTAQTPAGRII